MLGHMNEMEHLLYEEFSLCESKAYFMTDVLEEVYESVDASSIWASCKKFLQDMIEKVKEIYTKIRRKTFTKVAMKANDKALSDIRKALQKDVSLNKAEVEFYDVWKYEDVLKKAVKEMDKSTKMYLKQYQMVGAGLGRTDKFIDKNQVRLNQFEQQLAKLRKEKIKVSPQKALSWVEKQMKQGNDSVFSFVDSYTKNLEEYQNVINEFDKKAEKFANETGSIRRPKEFNEHVKNMSIFVKRNADWIGLFVASGATRLIGNTIHITDEDDAKEEYDSDPKNLDRGYSIFSNQEVKDTHVQNTVAAGRTKNQNRTRVGRASKMLGDAAGGLGALGATEAILSKRNSV